MQLLNMLSTDIIRPEIVIDTARELANDLILGLLKEITVPTVDQEMLDKILQAKKHHLVCITTTGFTGGQVTKNHLSIIGILTTVVDFVAINGGNGIQVHNIFLNDSYNSKQHDNHRTRSKYVQGHLNYRYKIICRCPPRAEPIRWPYLHNVTRSK